jgi:NAD(P)H-dependent FMN reductase
MKKLIMFFCLIAPLAAMAQMKVLCFAGSTRAHSYNKKLVREAAKIAVERGAKVTLIDLKDYPMPFYDADLEQREGMPTNAKRFRDTIMSSDAVIISSPQYNDSIPAVLKNALDWASRDEQGEESDAAFKGKKIVVLSASPGKKGGAKALVHLRAILKECGGDVLEKQVSVPSADHAFDETGSLKDPILRQQLEHAVDQLR